ncbi:MAG: VOC family protein [Nocardioidaceae bacterium]
MASVRTHLWFGNNKAVEAANFYAEHIPNSAVTSVVTARTDPSSPVAEVVEFTVAGHEVVGLNAGPELFHLNEAFSFYLRVDGQAEVDQYWEILTADGGEPGPCGWCKDKFGVSWQVIPRELEELSATTPARPTSASARRC